MSNLTERQAQRAADQAQAAADLNESLDAAYNELQGAYPGLDWEGPAGEAVSEALQAGFEIGRDFGNSYPE